MLTFEREIVIAAVEKQKNFEKLGDNATPWDVELYEYSCRRLDQLVRIWRDTEPAYYNSVENE